MPKAEPDGLFNPLQSHQKQLEEFSSKALDRSTKLVELNMKISKEILDNFSQSAHQFIAAKTPKEIFVLDTERMQKELNRIYSYVNEIGAAFSEINSELNNSIHEQFNQSCDSSAKFIEGISKIVPENAQKPFELLLSSVNNSKTSYDQLAQSSQKLAESLESNMSMMPIDLSSSSTKGKQAKSSSSESQSPN